MTPSALDLVLALIGTFVATVTIFLSVRALVGARVDPVRARLATIAVGRGGLEPVADRLAREDPDWVKVLRPLARLAQDTPEKMGKLQEQLAWAGYRSTHAVETYLSAKLIAALVFGGCALLADLFHPLPTKTLISTIVVATSIGFYTPTLVLRRKISERQRLISNALADSLDLLVSCVEAGLALEAALERVAREIGPSSPVLAEELLLTVREIEAGLSRSDAFRRLASRTGVGDLRSLAAILVQTEMFGTSIGRALRVMSDSMRTQRMQRANERAATVAVRLALPLILCLLPALMTVLMGGAVVRMIAIVFPTMKGAGNG